MKTRELNGYRVIHKPEHFNCMSSDNWKGYVYEHIYLIEKSLGRPLNKEEVVHHLDCDRSNNRIENLIVLSRGMHARLHAWLDKGGPTNPKDYKGPIGTRYCEVCGATLQGKQKHTCSKECNQIRKERLSSRPSKEQLAQDIKNMSWCAIGRKYGVSDNGVRRWARIYNLLK